mmetsp:Transcript_30383/g.76141  ORF Transcript_30383/g.76141 Transcript_30383/m.76141 type:complete len:226 (+) Transcript_30383:586-1263(+)
MPSSREWHGRRRLRRRGLHRSHEDLAGAAQQAELVVHEAACAHARPLRRCRARGRAALVRICARRPSLAVLRRGSLGLRRAASLRRAPRPRSRAALCRSARRLLALRPSRPRVRVHALLPTRRARARAPRNQRRAHAYGRAGEALGDAASRARRAALRIRTLRRGHARVREPAHARAREGGERAQRGSLQNGSALPALPGDERAQSRGARLVAQATLAPRACAYH